MRLCTEKIRPQALVHLGDFFDDGEVLAQEYPHLPVYQDPRNCDYYRCLAGDPAAVNAFRGEYMSNYSWAETTLGALEQRT